MDTTVIIVSYKSDHLIEKNIEKFNKETKIIIIDNSNDKNLKINIENKYKNVTVILNINKGFGQAANLGAKLANTKYLFFCSPDNYVEKKIHNVKKSEVVNINKNVNKLPKKPQNQDEENKKNNKLKFFSPNFFK